jgi:hypothetical protein
MFDDLAEIHLKNLSHVILSSKKIIISALGGFFAHQKAFSTLFGDFSALILYSV